MHKIKNWQKSFRLPKSVPSRNLEGLAFPSHVSHTRGGAAQVSLFFLSPSNIFTLPNWARPTLHCPDSANREMPWPHPAGLVGMVQQKLSSSSKARLDQTLKTWCSECHPCPWVSWALRAFPAQTVPLFCDSISHGKDPGWLKIPWSLQNQRTLQEMQTLTLNT